MQALFGLGALKAAWPRSVACIGTFDGVHRGHQAVIRRAVQLAESTDLPCCLVTFDRHPAAILAPQKAPRAISTLESNLRAFEELGVGIALILAFDETLCNMSADAFLQTILRDALKAEALVVGHDFAMGHNREGNPEWLSSRIDTVVVEPFVVDGERVSSSRIRAAVGQGDVELAERLLGRAYEYAGIVIPGNKIGRELGYPTANIVSSTDQTAPGDGIYAATATSKNGKFAAAVSIGLRPTFGGTDRTVEAYLLDYPGGSLYGKSIRLAFHRRIRPELKFPDLESLKAQIAQDVTNVASLLSAR